MTQQQHLASFGPASDPAEPRDHAGLLSHLRIRHMAALKRWTTDAGMDVNQPITHTYLSDVHSWAQQEGST